MQVRWLRRPWPACWGWRLAALLGAASLVLIFVIAQFAPRQTDLVFQLPAWSWASS
jgi:hypothetical protein